MYHKERQNKGSNFVDILDRARLREIDIGRQGISQSVSLIPVNPFLRAKIKELMHAGCSQRKQLIL